MKNLSKKELREIIQSGHLNLLVGSGCSLDYLTTLLDIENRMNEESTRQTAQNDYYKLIKKSKAILNDNLETDSGEKVNLVRQRKVMICFSLFGPKLFQKDRCISSINK